MFYVSHFAGETFANGLGYKRSMTSTSNVFIDKGPGVKEDFKYNVSHFEAYKSGGGGS